MMWRESSDKILKNNPVKEGKDGTANFPLIKTDSLVKKFGDKFAVDQVSFEVFGGEIFQIPGAKRRREDHDD